MKTRNIYIVCSAYKPPASSKYYNTNFPAKLNNMSSIIHKKSRKLIITCDMNCNYAVPNDHIDIKDIIKSYELSQIIKLPTCIAKQSHTIIDVLYTNDKLVISTTINHTNSLSNHNLIGFSAKIKL